MCGEISTVAISEAHDSDHEDGHGSSVAQLADSSILDPHGSAKSGSSGTDDGSLPGLQPQDAFGNREKPKPIGMQIGIQNRGNCFDFLGEGVAGHLSVTGAAEPIWHEIEITVDSGACDTVMPAHMCRDIRIDPSDPTIHCAIFEVANGASILNIGERRCDMMTEGSGVPKKITFQVADVHKPLLSITRLADNGYICALGKKVAIWRIQSLVSGCRSIGRTISTL